MLEAARLGCVRQNRTLFRSLDFTLSAGERLRIAGANGSGKTSLLRILCGLLTPNEGEVRWKGERIGELREDYSRQIVYLGHAPAVKDDLTAAENLEVTCRLAGMPVKANQALEQLGVPAGVPVRRLSQGQRRRAALARLVVSAAVPLWLLDEPFTALDPSGSDVVRAMIEAHAGRGGLVVFTTHHDAGVAASRVLELNA